MKLKLSVIASLLATAAGAQAQSSVTLFTLVDANVSHYTAGGKSGAANETTLNDGTTNGMNGSRWGIKTSEDLGGGLKANVLLEGGFSVATGQTLQGGRTFGRQGFIALASATAGELRIGRQYILEDSVMGQSNPFGNALTLNPGTSVTDKGKSLAFWQNAPRADGAITYFTPNFSGFSAAAQITDANASYDRFIGTKLAYSAGPLNTAMSYEWNKSRSTGQNVNKSLTVAANYNFGSFKLLGGLQRNRDLVTNSPNGAAPGGNLLVQGATSFTADQQDGYTLGVEVPVGAMKYGVNYTNVKYSNKAGASDKLGKFAAGASYNFSKNTLAYTAFSVATGGLKDYIAQKTVTQVGLRTTF